MTAADLYRIVAALAWAGFGLIVAAYIAVWIDNAVYRRKGPHR